MNIFRLPEGALAVPAKAGPLTPLPSTPSVTHHSHARAKARSSQTLTKTTTKQNSSGKVVRHRSLPKNPSPFQRQQSTHRALPRTEEHGAPLPSGTTILTGYFLRPAEKGQGAYSRSSSSSGHTIESSLLPSEQSMSAFCKWCQVFL